MTTTDSIPQEAVEAVLDAAHEYMRDQYGIGALNNPVDRTRVKARLTVPVTASTDHQASCVACDDRPSVENNPCAVCGKQASTPGGRQWPAFVYDSDRTPSPQREGGAVAVKALERLLRHQGHGEPTMTSGEPLGDNKVVSILCTMGDLRLARSALETPASEQEHQAASGDGWRTMDSAPKGKNGYSWMLLLHGDEEDPTVSKGMRYGDQYFAAAVFYVGGPFDQRQYAFREVEVKPLRWTPLPAALTPANPAGER